MLVESSPRNAFFRATVLSGVVIACLLLVSTVHAQGKLPARQDPFVNDFAEILAPEDVDEMVWTLSELERLTGIEAVVVTVDTFDRYDTGALTIKEFARHLAWDWEIGDLGRDDGVLIVMATVDLKLRVELGSSYSSTDKERITAVLNDRMYPSIIDAGYSRGLSYGVTALANELSPETIRPYGMPDVASSGSALLAGLVVLFFLVALGELLAESRPDSRIATWISKIT